MDLLFVPTRTLAEPNGSQHATAGVRLIPFHERTFDPKATTDLAASHVVLWKPVIDACQVFPGWEVENPDEGSGIPRPYAGLKKRFCLALLKFPAAAQNAWIFACCSAR
jgi:hypothetical protein